MPTWNTTLGGTWTDSGNWTGGVPNGVGAVANFNIATNTGTSIIVGILETSVIRLGQLNIDFTGTTGLALRGATGDTGTGTGRLIFNNGALDAVVTIDDVNSASGSFLISGTNGLRVELESNTVFNTRTNNPVVISAAVQGSGMLIKDGFGALELTGNNSFTGGIRIERGELIADGDAVGTGTITFGTTAGGVFNTSGTINNTISTLAGSTQAAIIQGAAIFTGVLSHQATRLELNPYGTMVAAFSLISGGAASNIGVGSGTLFFLNAYNAANLLNLAGTGRTVLGQSPGFGPATTTLDTGGFATVIRNPLLQNDIVLQASTGALNITFNDVHTASSPAWDLIINGTAGADQLIFNVTGTLYLNSDSNRTTTFNSWSTTDLIQINGNSSANTVTGSIRRDFIYGNDGDDILAGGGGIDTIDGGNGNDSIILNGDNDFSNVAGGAGTDNLRITGDVSNIGTVSGFEVLILQDNSAFHLSGAKFASGFDLFSTLSGTGSIVVNLSVGDQFVNARGMTVAGGSNIDLIVNGSSGVDVIKGALGATNDLRGGAGIDQIVGGSLADIITGGNDADKIRGDGGADTITGGSGADVFKFRNQSDSTVLAPDTITDFVSGTDKLNFKRIDTNPGLAGDQVFTYVGTAAFAGGGVASIRYTDLGADLRVEADVNGDGIADMYVLLTGAGTGTLSAGDFVL